MKSLSSTRIVTRQFLSAALLLLSASLTACAPTCKLGACATQAVARFATSEGFTTQLVEGKGFQHQVSWRTKGTPTAVLWVFIEGDGKPWSDDSQTINDDPSPRSTLAFQLAGQTDGAVLYLGRPCYFSARSDTRCSKEIWSSDRFSNDVVVSMNEALRAMIAQLQSKRAILVGHSGGGTLAALMASDLIAADSPPAALVTIAGNLDVEAWTSHHGYLPLTGSRNPAREAPLPATVPQFHLIGVKDTNVTVDMNARYFARVADTSVWRESRFDHSCCWALDWPHFRRRIERALPANQ
ncbi:MAG TPA: alpha/beta hydrolase [Steroidobacteraceae bacterium]|nr:alpha/beta hydrolase [Steroidobacteraceae bacterium]